MTDWRGTGSREEEAGREATSTTMSDDDEERGDDDDEHQSRQGGKRNRCGAVSTDTKADGKVISILKPMGMTMMSERRTARPRPNLQDLTIIDDNGDGSKKERTIATMTTAITRRGKHNTSAVGKRQRRAKDREITQKDAATGRGRTTGDGVDRTARGETTTTANATRAVGGARISRRLFRFWGSGSQLFFSFFEFASHQI